MRVTRMNKFSRCKLAAVVGAVLLPCAQFALAANPVVTISRVTPAGSTLEVGTEVTFRVVATDSDGNLRSIHFCRKIGSSFDNDDVCQVIASNITSTATSRAENVTKSFGPASVSGTKAVYYAYAVDNNGSRSALGAATEYEEIIWKVDVVVSSGNIATLQEKINVANGTQNDRSSIYVTGTYVGTGANPGIEINGKKFITLVGNDSTRIIGANTSNDVVSINNSKGIKILGFTIGNDVPGSETSWNLIKGSYGIVVTGGPTTSSTIPTGPSDGIVIGDNRVRLTASSGIRVDGARYVEIQNNVVEKTNAGAAYMYYAFGQRPEVTGTNWLIKDFFQADGLRKMHYRTDRDDNVAAKVDVANDCIQAFERESTGDSSNNKLFRPTQEMISVSKVKTGSNPNTYRQSSFVNVVGNEVFNGPWTINNVCVIGKEGIDLKSGSSNSNVEYNYVHDLHKLGIYVDAYQDFQENNIVNGNIVHHTKHGIALSVEDEDGDAPVSAKLLNVLVSNNRVYENDQDGIIVTDFGNARLRDKIKILNNTVVANIRHGINIGSDKVDNVFIVNNLVSNNGGDQIVRDIRVDSTQYSSRNNLVWRTNGGIACNSDLPSFGNAIGTNVVCAAPKINAIDFSLQSNSPAENVAHEGGVTVNGGASITVSSEVTKDATGARRPTSYDIGAMEYFQ